jgi:hypothetical protein
MRKQTCLKKKINCMPDRAEGIAGKMSNLGVSYATFLFPSSINPGAILSAGNQIPASMAAIFFEKELVVF